MLVASFAGLIATGTLGFLVLPGLWHGERVGVVDALFMTTSAVCVTGLSVLDVSSRMTFAGQAWLLALIQAGGLGILTFAALAARAMGGRASLQVEEAAGVPTLAALPSDPRTLVRSIVRVTLALELVGALLLWATWAPSLGALGAIWPALFHAISAFCNAGFSTFRDNLMPFADSVPTVLVISALIVLGGIGFLVIEDVRAWLGGRRRRIAVHTRIVLVTTAWLIVVPTFVFLAFEQGASLAALSPIDRVANALFLAITPRTAGFNTVDYASLTNPAILLTIALMWIGGSPASTAGGVKTTTAALLVLVLVSRLRGERHVSVSGRTIPDETIERATGLAVGAFLLLGAFVFLLLTSELAGERSSGDRIHMIGLVFEAQSALGTVGLSMGVTPNLTPTGKLLIVALMFLGRVGPIAVLGAMASRSRGRLAIRYGREDVLVG